MTDNDLKKLSERMTLARAIATNYEDRFPERLKALQSDISKSQLIWEALSRTTAATASRNFQIAEQFIQLQDTHSVVAQALIQATKINPLEELNQKAALMNDALLQHHKKFCIPDSSEINSLFPNLEKVLSRITVQDATASYMDKLDRALRSLTAPWLKIEDKMGSFTAISKMHEMGHLLNTKSIFSEPVLKNLRANLGNWRGKKLELPDEIFINPLVRHEFYIERGFDSSLTDFPPEAFEQAITVTGIKTKLPSLIPAYGYMPQQGMSKDEDSPNRTTKAYVALRNFESQIRKFIDSHMRTMFGDNWVKHQTSGEMYKKWRDRQDKSRNNNEEECPLIAYADFADYEEIVIQKDNWEKIFKPIFRRKTLVQESFCWLYPIRNCVMHSRIITLDDELYMHAALKKILKAIGVMV